MEFRVSTKWKLREESGGKRQEEEERSEGKGRLVHGLLSAVHACSDHSSAEAPALPDPHSPGALWVGNSERLSFRGDNLHKNRCLVLWACS